MSATARYRHTEGIVFPVGKGPAVAVGPNLHRKYTKKMIELAKEENIPYQIDVEPGTPVPRLGPYRFQEREFRRFWFQFL